MYRSSLAKVSRLLIVLALTIGELATGVFVTPVQPALGAVTQVFLPNITKTLGGANGPGIVAVEDSVIGPGLTFIYYGFAPNTFVTLDIRSSTLGGSYVENTDMFGARWGYLNKSFPAGAYNLSVSAGGKLVSIVARKA